MLLILIPIVLAGIAMLVLGIRGYRVGDHPVCRACAFDLFGLPGTQEVCPECGGSLRGGVFIGHKKRRPVMIGVGVVMMLIFLGIVGLIAAQIDYAPYKPLWWLKREAMSMTLRNGAVDEMNRRLKNLLLTQAQINDLSDLALSEQADLKKTWLPAFGDFVQTAHAIDKLDDARWMRFVSQAIQPPTLVLRQKIRRGDPLVVGELTTPARVGTSQLQLYCITGAMKTTGDVIKDVAQTGGGGNSIGPYGGGMSWSSIDCDREKLMAAAIGMHTIHRSVELKVGRDWNDEHPMLTKKYELEGDFELLPADAHPVKEIRDPSLQEKMNKAFTVEQFDVQSTYSKYYNLGIHASLPPAATAWAVTIKSGEKTWHAGDIHFAANGEASYGCGGEFKGLTADKADIILKPSKDACINSIDQYEYWVGEVVIKDVPVKRPATQPSKK